MFFSELTHRATLLLGIFLLISFGMGYGGLTRFEPRKQVRGLGDADIYYQMVQFDYRNVPAPFRYRILTPSLAGLLHTVIHRLSFGAWDKTALALLVINSMFVSLTALTLLAISRSLHVPPLASLLASFLYLLAFPVINGHLTGLVDAGEGFFIAVLILLVYKQRWNLSPLVVVLAALSKEATPVFMVVFLVVELLSMGYLSTRYQGKQQWLWLLLCVLAGGGTIYCVRALIGGVPYVAHQLSVARLSSVWPSLIDVLTAKSLVYTFAVILPLGLLGIKKLPRPFAFGSLAMGLLAIVLAAYAGVGENIYRPLFNTVGPFLIISSASFLGDWVQREKLTSGEN